MRTVSWQLLFLLQAVVARRTSFLLPGSLQDTIHAPFTPAAPHLRAWEHGIGGPRDVGGTDILRLRPLPRHSATVGFRPPSGLPPAPGVPALQPHGGNRGSAPARQQHTPARANTWVGVEGGFCILKWHIYVGPQTLTNGTIPLHPTCEYTAGAAGVAGCGVSQSTRRHTAAQPPGLGLQGPLPSRVRRTGPGRRRPRRKPWGKPPGTSQNKTGERAPGFVFRPAVSVPPSEARPEMLGRVGGAPSGFNKRFGSRCRPSPPAAPRRALRGAGPPAAPAPRRGRGARSAAGSSHGPLPARAAFLRGERGRWGPASGRTQPPGRPGPGRPAWQRRAARRGRAGCGAGAGAPREPERAAGPSRGAPRGPSACSRSAPRRPGCRGGGCLCSQRGNKCGYRPHSMHISLGVIKIKNTAPWGFSLREEGKLPRPTSLFWGNDDQPRSPLPVRAATQGVHTVSG